MAFRWILFVGAVAMGLLMHAPRAFTHDSVCRSSDEQICSADFFQDLSASNNKKPIDWSSRPDLQGMVREVAERAQEMDPSCFIESLSEVYLLLSERVFLAGFEVLVSCEDTPSPAVLFYFDLNQRFLGTVVLGN